MRAQYRPSADGATYANEFIGCGSPLHNPSRLARATDRTLLRHRAAPRRPRTDPQSADGRCCTRCASTARSRPRRAALGLSYRHVWGELKRWETELGHAAGGWRPGPLGAAVRVRRQAAVGRAPGAGPAGAADRGAARRPRARLCAGLRRQHARAEPAREPRRRAGRCCARMRPRSAQLHLDIRFTGSVDAISALNQGRCVMAGFHTLRAAAAGLARAAHLQAAAQARAAQDDRLRAAHARA